MGNAPLINITIPVFNRPQLTEQTIRSVKRNTALPHVVTVVDNGSEEETRTLLCELKAAGLIDHLFRLEKNYGVACAANVGWRMISCPIYMKLDNDILIKSPKWLDILLMQFRKIGKPAVLGGDFHNQLAKPDFVRKRDGILGKTYAHVSGGAILIPQEVSDVVGYWSEDYGLYGCEDGDYGVRLKVHGISQYYFDHKPFMEHLGHDEQMYRDKYSLDKKDTQHTFRYLWTTNHFLFKHRHRAPHSPLQYKVHDFDGYTVTLKSNTAYRPMWKALIELHNTFNTCHEDSAPFIKALNRFISVQNATWQDAIDEVDNSYCEHRIRL